MDSTQFSQRCGEVKEWLSKEFATIRTGQATPTLLDGIKVQSYGTFMSLQQVASVGTEDARTLRITPWDTSLVKVIEKAITDADLGVSLVSDGAGVRVIFPELTGERRQQLVKLAKVKLEEARVSVRGLRDEAMKKLDLDFKEGNITEDERFAGKERIQKIVDVTNQELEGLFIKKETEISR